LPGAINARNRATCIPAKYAALPVPEVPSMGDVAIRMRIMPESTDIDLAKLKDAIKTAVPSHARLHAVEEKPIAFGLKALIVVTIMDDKGGHSPEETEVAFSKIPGVESVEVEEVGLI
jgi:elongation factor 1-beta